MLKYSALLFNTIALLICKFFFVNDIKITQSFPSTAKPDSEFIVEITINKGEMGGFAKLQQFIPQGLTASPVEMKGGDFKFIDQQVKIIWMSLPSDKEFKIKYKVKIDAGVGGDKKIGGKFSYVVDNVKQEVEIPESVISIKSGEDAPIVAEAKTETPKEEPKAETPVVAETKTETPKEEPKAETPVVAETKTETPKEEPKPETPVVAETKTETPKEEPKPETPASTETKAPVTTDAAGVSCVRSAPSNITTSEFVVEIKINKGNLTGFAKLLESLPAGFSASAQEVAGGTFSFADQKVKLIWYTLPSQPEFTISYKVSAPAGTNGNINIDGVFSFIENDQTQKYTIAPTTLALNISASNPVVTNTETPKTETTATAATSSTTTTTTSTNTENNGTKSVDATPVPQSNVVYRVQIAALHNAVPASNLAMRYGISENVITEMMDGFTKYTFGSHKEYKSARDSRELVKTKGVVGPFVTAYNSGKRITVQEALMLTSQQWYK